MAKCLRMVGQGVPARYSDEEAAQIIREGDGEYCSKTFFKEWWRAPSAAEYLKSSGVQPNKAMT